MLQCAAAAAATPTRAHASKQHADTIWDQKTSPDRRHTKAHTQRERDDDTTGGARRLLGGGAVDGAQCAAARRAGVCTIGVHVWHWQFVIQRTMNIVYIHMYSLLK